MRDFAYLTPTGARGASRLLAAGTGAVLKAGGVDLLDLMKEGLAAPGVVVNLGGVKGLRGIAVSEDRVSIGPLTTLAELAADPILRSRFPALSQAAEGAATPQIRNVATLGGNLCQRPRCWYFRSAEFHCLKKGGERCFAEDGLNQYHAVFGDGPCHIVHPSAAAVALLALDGTMHTVSGADGGRSIPAGEFFVLPAQDVDRENVLADDEVIHEITLPATAPARRSAYVKIKEKDSFDWPLAEAAVSMRIESGLMRGVRVVLGHAAPVPWRSRAAEAALEGKAFRDEAALGAAGAAAMAGAKPMSGNAYKLKLFPVALARAVRAAAGGGGA